MSDDKAGRLISNSAITLTVRDRINNEGKDIRSGRIKFPRNPTVPVQGGPTYPIIRPLPFVILSVVSGNLGDIVIDAGGNIDATGFDLTVNNHQGKASSTKVTIDYTAFFTCRVP